PQSPNAITVTYPDVGRWLYGPSFAQFLTTMICIQQLAVCTVFMSFIAENLAAALQHLVGQDVRIPHALVITLVLPSVLLLVTCLSNLKVLAPLLTVATLTLFAGFAVLAGLVVQAWPQRPRPYVTEIQDWNHVPLAICAILFSFEGICLILPIETSMAAPKHFGWVFSAAMAASAIIFASVASFCVMAFGRVSSGSITAFLVEQQHQQQQQQGGGAEDREENLEILNMANLLVSLAVLLTYPLQLFPSYELVGPAVAKYFTTTTTTGGGGDVSTIDDMADAHGYIAANSDGESEFEITNTSGGSGDDLAALPLEAPFSDEDVEAEQRQAAAMRRNSEEIPMTAESSSSSTSTTNQQNHPETSYWNYYGTSYGDIPPVRIGLVLITYSIAIVVPNVQLLVSLAGAVSGSATGLLVPPLLQLAHYQKMEQQERQEQLLQLLAEEEESSTTTSPQAAAASAAAYGSWYYQRRRLQCYILFLLGCIVLVIGTVSALWDIVKVYRGVG
ncbi:MAG: hypothetical protein SGBAC_013005, partial [Bacillariaceae sp.]